MIKDIGTIVLLVLCGSASMIADLLGYGGNVQTYAYELGIVCMILLLVYSKFTEIDYRKVFRKYLWGVCLVFGVANIVNALFFGMATGYFLFWFYGAVVLFLMYYGITLRNRWIFSRMHSDKVRQDGIYAVFIPPDKFLSFVGMAVSYNKGISKILIKQGSEFKYYGMFKEGGKYMYLSKMKPGLYDGAVYKRVREIKDLTKFSKLCDSYLGKAFIPIKCDCTTIFNKIFSSINLKPKWNE